MTNPKVNFAGFLLGLAALCLGAGGAVVWFLAGGSNITNLTVTVIPIIVGLTVVMFAIKNRKSLE